MFIDNARPFSDSVKKFDHKLVSEACVANPTYERATVPFTAVNPALTLVLPLPKRLKCQRTGVDGPEITEMTREYCIACWKGGHCRDLTSNETVCGTDELLGEMLNAENNVGAEAIFDIGIPDEREDVHSSQEKMKFPALLLAIKEKDST